MGLLWITKLYNAQPVPKAVPLVGSLFTGDKAGEPGGSGYAWQVEYQGKAGYAWQTLGFDQGFGVSPGFYQAVVDSYTWAREHLMVEDPDPDRLSAAIGPYILSAKMGCEYPEGAGDSGVCYGMANLVWPGNAARLLYNYDSPEEQGAGAIDYFIYQGEYPDPDNILHEKHDLDAMLGIDQSKLPKQDELLGATFVGLRFLARQGAGLLLEGRQ